MEREWLLEKPVDVAEFGRCRADAERDALLLATVSTERARDTLRRGFPQRHEFGVRESVRLVREEMAEKRVLRVNRYPAEARYADTFNIDFEGISAVDKQTIVDLISEVGGSAAVMATLNPEEFAQNMKDGLYEAILGAGFAMLSDTGRERLGEIFDVLKTQLAEMGSQSVNPFAVSQYWTQQFDQYKDWEFARLARTEAAFAARTTKMEYLKQSFDADDWALTKNSAFPPIHPNCLCDIQPMVIGDFTFMYLDTSLEPCALCNDLADKVLADIESHAAELPPPTTDVPDATIAVEEDAAALEQANNPPVSEGPIPPKFKSSAAWLKWLKKNQFEKYEAVQLYLLSWYNVVNSVLREGGTGEGEIGTVIDDLSSALDCGVNFKGTVFRGLAGLSEADANKWLNASTIKLDAFTSTSESRDVAQQFLEHNRGGEGTYGILAEIESTNGKKISVGPYADEREVLFQKGTSFEILSTELIPEVYTPGLTYVPAYYHVKLREVT